MLYMRNQNLLVELVEYFQGPKMATLKWEDWMHPLNKPCSVDKSVPNVQRNLMCLYFT